MKEQIISLETGELAKKKGFDNPVRDYASLGEKFDGDITYYHYTTSEPSRWNCIRHTVALPTQSLLQRWLREEHGYHVQPQKTFHNNTYTVGKIPTESRLSGDEFKHVWNVPNSYITTAMKKKFKTYEEALEYGLQEALKVIRYGKEESIQDTE